MPFQLQSGEVPGDMEQQETGTGGDPTVTMQPFNRAELPDLANKKTGCPVKFELQINNE